MKAKYIGQKPIFKGNIRKNKIYDVVYIDSGICYISVENDVVGLSSSYVKLINDNNTKTLKFDIIDEYDDVISTEGIIENNTHIKTIHGVVYNKITHRNGNKNI